MKASKPVLRIIGAYALAAALAVPAFSATTSKVEYAPPVAGAYLQPNVTGVSVDGTVVGTSQYIGGDDGSTAVLWNPDGSLVNLTPNGGEFFYGAAADINNHGQVLLMENDDIYVVDNGTRLPIQTGLYKPTALGMNDAMQIVGSYLDTSAGNPRQHAFVHSDGAATDLGTLAAGSVSTAYDINNFGVIVGDSVNADKQFRAVMWRDGVITDLGTLPGDTASSATAINDQGWIVGTSTGTSGTRAFLWQDGVMTSLGNVGDNAYIYAADINNAGEVVGYARPQIYSGRATAFLWSNGVFRNLNPLIGQPGAYGCSARALSNTGVIAGGCTDKTYRLTPTADGVDVGMEIYSTPAVPYTANQDAPLVYTIRVANVGSLPATGVTVSDVLPAGASLESAVSSQGTCSGNPAVTCAIGDLAAGAEAVVTLTVKPTQTGSLANSASVSLNEPDVNTVNNSDSTAILVNPPLVYADLGITMIAKPTVVKRGQFASYIMTVTNHGPQDAEKVFLSDTIPGFYSITTTQGTCGGPGYINQSLVSCVLGRMAAGSSATVTLTIRSYYTGTYTNTARVSSSATDTNTSNNTASATVTVVR